jgi:hypothetical protein
LERLEIMIPAEVTPIESPLRRSTFSVQ